MGKTVIPQMTLQREEKPNMGKSCQGRCGSLFRRYYGVDIYSATSVIEADVPIDQRKNCIIAAQPNILSRQEFSAALTHDDVAGHNQLASKFFYAQTFANTVTAVLDTALSFFMSHGEV
jgi:hypothetical protein